MMDVESEEGSMMLLESVLNVEVYTPVLMVKNILEASHQAHQSNTCLSSVCDVGRLYDGGSLAE